MHKELHILGLLLSGSRTGYQLHRIVVAHGELYADLKKGNVYYLLEKLAGAGALQVTTEPGAPGPRRERLVYTLTDYGRRRFHELLREVVRTYEPAHSGVEVGMVFLPYLDPQESIQLLEERRQQAIVARRTLIEHETRAVDHLHMNLAQDHLLSMIDAELAWLERTLPRLRQGQEAQREEDTTIQPASSAARCPSAPEDNLGDDPV
ncbi:MAG TPA: PadR family transcriptional regulator [Ktedonobacterales bacterium]|nr:PadR family transcriptional regulator [Ktedonobacterales bacterium]